MIRLVLFDLGDTLVSDEPFPHVIPALEATAQLETADGEPLLSCLVSDYHLAQPPDDAEGINSRFSEYLELLDSFGLTQWFEPVDERVTLSTNAGVMKPDRRVFELAVERSGIDATLNECLFITENLSHIEAARALGLTTLHFDSDVSVEADFHDWSEGPLLIRQAVAPHSAAGLAAALSTSLAATSGVEVLSIQPGSDGRMVGQGRVWVSLDDPDLGPLVGTHVQVPVPTSVVLDKRGHVRDVNTGEPGAEALNEVLQFTIGLLRRGQVALSADSVDPGQTHEVTTDADGRRRLRRRRFS